MKETFESMIQHILSTTSTAGTIVFKAEVGKAERSEQSHTLLAGYVNWYNLFGNLSGKMDRVL